MNKVAQTARNALLLLMALCTLTLVACATPTASASSLAKATATRITQVGAKVTTTATRRPTSTATARSIKKATATPRPKPARIDGFRVVYATELTREAQRTLVLIARGGPFPFRQDGVVFQNRERILPIKARGYYHEYTVITPGEDDRGARRIITGNNGEIYYTDDHYESFVRVLLP